MSNKSFIDESDELDLKSFWFFTLRNIKKLSYIGILGLFLTFLSIFFQKEIWKGELQIVLDSNIKNKSNILNSISNNSYLSPFLKNGLSSKNQLNTEKEILKSPSVLMPIFEFVKAEKMKNGQKVDFSTWRTKSLNVTFLKGTSILRLNYLDEDEKLILPVLNKISSTYQNYPERNRILSLKNGIEYLDKQIKEYKNKSKKSIIKFEEFSSKNDMPFILDILKKDTKTPSLESIRISATNSIREIDQKLIELENISNNKELKDFISLLRSSPITTDKNLNSLQESLDKVENELIEAKSRLKPNDPKIIEILGRRDILLKKIEANTIGFLKMKKINAELLKKSASRPKDVSNKYRLLIIEANRDQKILSKLINAKEELSLSIAKNEKPWQLISEPEIYKTPSKPYKNRTFFAGFFITIFLGYLYCFIFEKEKGLIFDSNLIRQKYKGVKKVVINSNANKLQFNEFEFFILNLSDKEKESIGILDLSEDTNLEIVINETLQKLNLKNYILTKEIKEFSKFNYKIIVIKTKKTLSEKLQNTAEALSLSNKKIDVIVIYEEN